MKKRFAQDIVRLLQSLNRPQPKNLSMVEHEATLYSKHKPNSDFWADFNVKQLEILDTPEFPLSEVLKWQKSFDVIFDIGSGPGWLSGYLSGFGKKVFAVEPSALANEIAKANISASNLTIVEGFAEDFLETYEDRNGETLFVIQSVLQHLSDPTTIRILRAINSFSNAYLCFAEPYSETYRVNQGTTNVRKMGFYQQHLSRWDLFFSGGDVSTYFDGNTVHKGFYGRTKSKSSES